MKIICPEEKKRILACDSGGSKTVLRLLDTQGNTLCQSRCGGVASLKAGMLPVEDELKKGLAQLDAFQPEDLLLGYLSLGGPNTGEVSGILSRLLGGAKVVVEREASGDMMLTAASFYDSKAAILVGTGSVAVGFRNGKRVFSGGWGPLLDDMGSGGNLGLSALKYFLFAVDGRVPVSPGADAVFSFLKQGLDLEIFAERMELKTRANALTRKELASFVPEIFAQAEKGDEVLSTLIRESAYGIAQMAYAVTDPSLKEKKILACGGMFQAGEEFRRSCDRFLAELCPGAEFVFARPDSMTDFAAVRALTLCGITDHLIHKKQLEA